jgi:hypothetical protein
LANSFKNSPRSTNQTPSATICYERGTTGEP